MITSLRIMHKEIVNYAQMYNSELSKTQRYVIVNFSNNMQPIVKGINVELHLLMIAFCKIWHAKIIEQRISLELVILFLCELM